MTRIAARIAARWRLLLVGLILLSGLGAASVWWRRHPETTPALRGQRIAHELGCFACHGADYLHGVADPSLRDGTVPSWESSTVALYIKSEAEIREWILDGRLTSREMPPRPAGEQPLIPMPAYRGSLTDRELDELVVFFKAVSGWDPKIPDAAHEGRQACVRLGCFGCHGPGGIGGVPNPGSFKGHIPPWDGDEYTDLVADGDELREWILDGRVERLWSDPVPRHFLEQQKTQMPPYRAHVSQEELDNIATYICTLRGDCR